jgi:hypothetical protein
LGMPDRTELLDLQHRRVSLHMLEKLWDAVEFGAYGTGVTFYRRYPFQYGQGRDAVRESYEKETLNRMQVNNYR